MPPLKTGIADYVAELLPYLDRYFDLEIFVDDSYAVSEELSRHYKIFPHELYSERTQTRRFDLNVYQMGNNEHHSYIYEQAIRVPGLVVLHDLSLSFMLYHHYAGVRNDLATFRKEFLFSEGEHAVVQFDRLYSRGDNGAVMDFFSDHHMLRRLVGRSYAILSHLEYCVEVARERYGAKNTYSMYLGSPDPNLELPGITKQAARKQLGISDEVFLMGVFGHLQPNKQNDVVVRALARIKARHPHVLLTFVGEMNPALNYDEYIRDLIKKLNLEENVRLTGFVSRQEMQKYYLASDVVVNLRYPSFGQMSATLSRGIATGRPAIITDLPEWRFFPEDFCWRVPADDTEGVKLSEYGNRLMENPQELEQRGNSARDFYLKIGTSQKAAENLQGIIYDVMENSSGQVMLEELPVSSTNRYGIIKNAFEEWDRLRAGGKNRYKFERLRRIPVIGSFLFTAFVLFANLIQVRKIRRAEWALNNALVAGITNLSADVENRITNKIVKLEVDAKRLNKETRDEYVLEPIRVWDDPLASIKNYIPERQGGFSDENSGEMYYIALEQAFRGSEETIRGRQVSVLAEIKSYTDLEADDLIVDIGCGRGEFLSLLQNEGLHPIGVETNNLLIEKLKEKGFEVHAMDLFEFLSTLPDGKLKGITAFHIIEHLTHDQNMAFLSLANKKLAVGGFIYLETPNPLCPDSLSRFYTDPTHQRPIQPFQLSFQMQYNNFNKLKVLFLEPLKTRGSLSSERWITLYQDYGILATK